MRPEREFLMAQATACRQLALISEDSVAGKLKALAAEYEALALFDPNIAGGEECERWSQEPMKPLMN